MDWQTIVLAIGLVFVLEGFGYAAFPGGMRRMMGKLVETDTESLRVIGFVALFVGLVVIWFISG